MTTKVNTKHQNQNASGLYVNGFLFQASIGAEIPYKELERLAAEVGLDDQYIPAQPVPRNLWERHTGSLNNIKIELNDAQKAEIQQAYAVLPETRLYVRVINDSAPELVRHLVREVTVGSPKTEEGATGLGQVATRQRVNQTVAIFKYNIAEKTAKYLTIPGFQIEEEIERLIEGVRQLIAAEVEGGPLARSQDIRYGLRKFLEERHRVPLSQGGLYFIPNQAKTDVYADLMILKAYIDGLKHFSPGGSTGCLIYRVNHDGDAFDIASEVAVQASKTIAGRMKALREEANELHKKKGKYREKAENAIKVEWEQIMAAVEAIQNSLGTSLRGLDRVISDTSDHITMIGGDQIPVIEAETFAGQIAELDRIIEANALDFSGLDSKQETVEVGGYVFDPTAEN